MMMSLYKSTVDLYSSLVKPKRNTTGKSSINKVTALWRSAGSLYTVKKGPKPLSNKAKQATLTPVTVSTVALAYSKAVLAPSLPNIGFKLNAIVLLLY